MQNVLIKTAFLINKLGLGNLFFSKVKRFSGTYRNLFFLAQNAKDLKWVGENEFVVKKLGVNFRLGGLNFIQMEHYFKFKDQICFERDGGNFFACLFGLRIQLLFPSGIIELKETFLDEEYGFFDLKGANVLDVGAFIGDTALYFASKGASRVLAFEPSPPSFELALNNVALNHFEDTIKLYGEAVGVEQGTLKINYLPEFPGKSSVNGVVGEAVSFEAKVKPLDVAIQELGHVDLLKMDCEGAEWQIIPCAVEKGWLKNVSRIILEVHQGNISDMQKVLEKANFKVLFTKAYSVDSWLLAAKQ